MSLFVRLRWAALALAVLAAPAAAQETGKTPIPAPAEPQLPPPPPRTAVAAKVNGESIPEIAVYRALARVHPGMRDQARQEILNFLVETTLVDQYLERLKVAVDPKEVDERLDTVRKEIEKEGHKYDEFLQKLYLTEDELKEQIAGTIRWDNFTTKQISDDSLKQMFEKNKDMFDGSLVRARHILIKPADDTPAALEQAKAKAAALRQQVEAEAAKAAGAPGADKLEAEKKRREALEKAFGDVATASSDCPSKKNAGELGWFPRLGKMVEPFAQAAFALDPYQMSPPVQTEFGYHIILTTDRKPGRDITFDQAKLFVRDVYSEKLREAVLARMRPISKVEFVEAAGN